MSEKELLCIEDHTIEFEQGGYGVQINLIAGEKYKVECLPLYLNWNGMQIKIPFHIFELPEN